MNVLKNGLYQYEFDFLKKYINREKYQCDAYTIYSNLGEQKERAEKYTKKINEGSSTDLARVYKIAEEEGETNHLYTLIFQRYKIPYYDQPMTFLETIKEKPEVLSYEAILERNKRKFSFTQAAGAETITPDKLKTKLQTEFQDAQRWLKAGYNDYWENGFPPATPFVEPLISNTFLDKGFINAGIASTVGRREGEMEDAHVVELLQFEAGNRFYNVPLFALFDGHGGPECAQFLSKHLPTYLAQELQEVISDDCQANDLAVFNTLKLACVNLEQRYWQEYGEILAGSTAVISFIFDQHLWVANIGDSRAMLSKNGQPIALSEDAKLSIDKYQRGSIKRGAEILYHENSIRVDGVYAMARAVGDSRYVPGTYARPKIINIPLDSLLDKESNYLVLTCDGVTDEASTEQIIQSVDQYSKIDASSVRIAEHIVRKAHAANSLDNISAVIIDLHDFLFTTVNASHSTNLEGLQLMKREKED